MLSYIILEKNRKRLFHILSFLNEKKAKGKKEGPRYSRASLCLTVCRCFMNANTLHSIWGSHRPGLLSTRTRVFSILHLVGGRDVYLPEDKTE